MVVDGYIGITINLKARWRNVENCLEIEFWRNREITPRFHHHVTIFQAVSMVFWKLNRCTILGNRDTIFSLLDTF